MSLILEVNGRGYLVRSKQQAEMLLATMKFSKAQLFAVYLKAMTKVIIENYFTK